MLLPRPRRALPTAQFAQWRATLSDERVAGVDGAIRRVLAGGPTLGRPRVDTIHGTRLHKLKEARVDRGTRLLFAFDSNRDLVMLLGGDKSGKWKRWYPAKIAQAERLYEDHERRIGAGAARSLNHRAQGRTSSPRDL